MKIVITGTSRGIGRAIAEKFLSCGHTVIGIDRDEAPFACKGYTHVCADILTDALPALPGTEILINNAGVQDSGHDIDVNLKGTIRVTEAYAFQDAVKSVLFIASASARNGAEFPEYAASKGGMVAYMKNVALRIARFGATANSLSPGGSPRRSMTASCATKPFGIGSWRRRCSPNGRRRRRSPNGRISSRPSIVP